MIVICKIHQLELTKLYQSAAWILTGAILFAMQSCEQLKTKVRKEENYLSK